MTTHIVPLPWVKPPVPTLNAGLRSSSVHAKAGTVRAAKSQAGQAIRRSRVPKGIAGVELTLHYRVPDRRRRDADNLAPTLKVCQDALVATGVIFEDSWITVPSATCRIHPPTDEGPALWLEIEEIQ